MKTASHVQSSQPATPVGGTWRATYHQPSRAAMAASGSATMSIVRVAGLHHRGRRDGERRGRHQGTDGQQGEREAERPARRVLAGRLQQGETARRRGAQSGQRADQGRRPGAERLAQHQRLDQRARHHQQAGLLERRGEAQPERLADRLEGHVGWRCRRPRPWP